jgi:hypothetical protein
MSKDPHIANIFSAEEEDCLSLEQMTAYQESRLQGQEKHLVERHLLNCELCVMTFESMAEHGAESLAAGAEEVSERAWDRLQQGEKRKRRGAIFWIASAASVALLITVGYFTFRGPAVTGDQNPYAMNEPSAEELDKAANDIIKNTDPLVVDSFEPELFAGADGPKEEQKSQPTMPVETIMESGAKDKMSHTLTESKGAAKGGKGMDNGVAGVSPANRALGAGGEQRYDPNRMADVDGDPSPNDPRLLQAAPTPAPSGTTFTMDDGNFAKLNTESYTGGIASRDKALDNDSKDARDRSLVMEPLDSKKQPAKEEMKAEEGYAMDDFGDDLAGTIATDQLEMEDAEAVEISAEKSGKADRNYVMDERRNENAKPAAKSKTANAGADAPKAAMDAIATNAAPRQDAYSDGIDAYEQGNYREAAAQLRKATEATPGNLNAHLFAADAYLRISQPQAAMFHIERILASPGNSVYEEGEWYKALAYLQLKEARKAEKQLEVVIARNGKFREKAQAALNALK